MSTIGYSDIALRGNTIQYSLYLDPQEIGQWIDLHGKKVFVIGPDEEPKANENGIGWERSELERLVADYLTVKNNDTAGLPEMTDAKLVKRGETDYVRMDLQYEFEKPIERYQIEYRFFFDDLDPKHRNIANVTAGEGETASTTEHIFNSGSREFGGNAAVAAASAGRGVIKFEVPGWMHTFWTYTVMGMEHIWEGYDHLVFLLGLVILKQKKPDYLKMLTAFTVGHSITLALSALDIFTISLNIVEPLIALSIIYIAAENIWLKHHTSWRWLAALLFGFVHGFGFADILRGSLGGNYVLSLFSFNLGVELGQLAALAVLLPLLAWGFKVRWYPSMAFGVSGIIGAVGCFWFIERLWDTLAAS
ncbi:HupE/UreJ family protein [Paenibacillus thermotolerans]|uniref:HupE/UreJ family protein n=1 Tax=Paenibacillus thermotolerans TaxID=3027807 RepID=UPI0023678416|nr:MULTISPECIES: HupE/UreJ family protein [unclassified Paenibacillus]